VFSLGYVVVEDPCSILEVPKDSTEQPRSLVNVVSKTSSGHSLTLPWSPSIRSDPLGSQGHHQYRHLPLSLRGNLSVFAVVLVSETPNQTDGLPRVRVNRNPHVQRLAATLHHTLVNSDEYSRGFGSKLSFSSTFFTQS
jgi:hypothetical protein